MCVYVYIDIQTEAEAALSIQRSLRGHVSRTKLWCEPYIKYTHKYTDIVICISIYLSIYL